MASALGLQDSVCKIASAIYRRAVEADLLEGRSIEGLATAALRLVTRQVALLRTIDEFVQVGRVGKPRILSASRYLSRELGLEVHPSSPVRIFRR
jgi:transcription initiation factor TFIIB